MDPTEASTVRPGNRRYVPAGFINPSILLRASLVLVLFLSLLPSQAADPAEARKKILSGEYQEAIELATTALAERPRSDDWHLILIESLLTVGRYPEAQRAFTNALARSPRSLPIRWIGREVLLRNGRPADAADMVTSIAENASQRPGYYRDPSDLMAVGRAMVLLGADPKEVLDRIYLAARKAVPNLRDSYLAAGELALAKHDSALAARQFDEGIKKFPTDPDLLAGRARAFLDGERKEMAKSLEAALKTNPRHIPSMLLLVEHRIDAEDYDTATQTLKEIHAVNPAQPDAWAFAAVIAHLRNDAAGERNARSNAVRYWRTDPGVPHLIGRKLSQKYRFAEGAALQREALRHDPNHLPAKAQLASDLLRLGEEGEGWELVQQVHDADAYDVTAFNLTTLEDSMKGFVALTNAHFIVRMSSQEAGLYGHRVLALLERARTNLVPRYGHDLSLPTIVEIFPNPKDFGVRTFGMPDNPGYLGVCFGRVITANSPAANRNTPVNWEAVLWHEFCHVITLQKTANKMPRWLSEGISVFEERRANPSWGEQISPRYREMILGTDLTPVSRLSAAFLTPKSPVHLQFAYFQSSLVIDFIVQRFGFSNLVDILNALREGAFINDAIARHTEPMDDFQKNFAVYARKVAESLGPGLDWTNPKDSRDNLPPGVAALAENLPLAPSKQPNFYQLKSEALRLIEAREWGSAKVPLRELVRLYPNETGADSAQALLARVHRALGESDEERDALEKWAALDDAAPEAYARLMELETARGDWTAVLRNGSRYLAVNPLVPTPHRYLARAAEATGDPNAAISSFQTLLRLDPPNPPEVHYELARLLVAKQPADARRHLLESLQDAPRHRAGLALLLKMDAASTVTNASPASTSAPTTNAPTATAAPAATPAPGFQ
jgi:tetratricopeptide (TPR) repeat protein